LFALSGQHSVNGSVSNTGHCSARPHAAAGTAIPLTIRQMIEVPCPPVGLL